MPFVDNQGFSIYYKTEGQGQPLLLVHGMFVDSSWWSDLGFVRALAGSYRLVMVDVRGHGQSEKPHDPTQYEIRVLVSDLLCVLDALGLDQVHYLGYSMGGWLGFAAAKYAPDRFRSFILGGIHPYADYPGHQVNLSDLPEQGMEGFVASFERTGRLTEAQRAGLLSNDVYALAAMTHNPRADYSELLPSIHVPCLLYSGDADVRYPGIEKCARELPDATFVPLPGYDHLGVLMNASSELLPHISEFLARLA